MIDYISNERDKKNLVGMYSVDLTAAFDLLQKEKLVPILIKKGFPKYLISCIYNYLSDRFGYVQLDESISCIREIKAGCIQGSILGPVLYNIFTSSLIDIVHPCKLVVYADDAYVIASCDNKEKLLNLLTITIAEHFKWLDSIGMICNLSKTELISFGTDELHLTVCGNLIKSKETMKVLGVLVDNKLTWEHHISKVISSCRSKLFALRYLRQNLNMRDTFTIFRSHIISRLVYCSPAWSVNLSYPLLSKLRSIFYHVIRVLLRDFSFDLNRKKLLQKANTQSLDIIFLKRNSVFLFNIIKSTNPSSLACNLFSRSYQNDRHPDRITFFDLSKTKIGKKSILNNAKYITERWNFEWLSLSTFTFKKCLTEMFG